MQRGRGGRDDFFGFGDPFSGFGGFGRPGSLFPSLFGGRDPFGDPFFTRPLGSMMGPSMFGPSIFGSSMISESPFGAMNNGGFLEQQPPQPNKSKGPIIKELSSDEEEEGEGEGSKETEVNTRKHSRSSKEPHVQDPEEEMEEKKSKHTQYRNDYSRSSRMQPKAQTYSFYSSTVTYGGPSGAYYTSSTTRRTGGDRVTMEEKREADTTTRKATHRISKGIRDKGHSVTRRLNSDGKVDTVQTLHNLNEEELSGFEEVWKGNVRQHLPGWNEGFDMLGNGNFGGSSGQNDQPSRRGWALPSAERLQTYGQAKAQPWTDSSNGGAK